jgi:peptidoglycan/LPS O-acetylase OafA/YrhL
LAVPFVLAFALRADLARLNAPAAVQYLADGSYLLVDLLFVLAGFLLCRPLCAVLSGTGGSLFTDTVRRIAPLHLAAWAITFGWVVTGAAPGTVSGWLSSALLLNGFAGPELAGYPMSWSVSVALGGLLLLVITALALSRAESKRRIPAIPPGRLVTAIAVTAGLIGAALLLPTGLLPALLPAELAAAGTVGPAAIGQALLGLAVGLLSFRALEGGTGPLNPPRPGTAPAPRPAPGLGALVTLAMLVFCIYRSDLVHELDLLPIFPVAAALVYFLAVPHAAGSGPVSRLLSTGPLQWLGSRALALYLLHGPVQLTVERISEISGFDRESTPVTYGVIGAVVLGSLVAAELGHRLLERAVARPAPAPVAPVSVYRIPRSRPERISQIDPETIPQELRLLPLPRKSAAGKPIQPISTDQISTDPATIDPATTDQVTVGPISPDPVTADQVAAGPAEPVAEQSSAPAVGATSSKPTTAKPATPTRTPPSRPTMAPISASASQPTTAPTTAPTGTPASELVATRFGKPVGKPRSRPVSKPKAGEAAPSKPAGRAVRAPVSKATAKPIEPPTTEPTAKPIELPADSPDRRPTKRPAATSIELPADQHIELPIAEAMKLPPKPPTALPTDGLTDGPAGKPIEQGTAKPARRPAPRKRVAKASDQPIDLDRPSGTLDADA